MSLYLDIEFATERREEYEEKIYPHACMSGLEGNGLHKEILEEGAMESIVLRAYICASHPSAYFHNKAYRFDLGAFVLHVVMFVLLGFCVWF